MDRAKLLALVVAIFNLFLILANIAVLEFGVAGRDSFLLTGHFLYLIVNAYLVELFALLLLFYGLYALIVEHRQLILLYLVLKLLFFVERLAAFTFLCYEVERGLVRVNEKRIVMAAMATSSVYIVVYVLGLSATFVVISDLKTSTCQPSDSGRF
ncbi:unnamed protein product, partial [Mesorhabditis spiculigera]